LPGIVSCPPWLSFGVRYWESRRRAERPEGNTPFARHRRAV